MKRIPDNLENLVGTVPTEDETDKYDKDFSVAHKQHRNRLYWLDNYLQYLLHPLVLFLVVGLIWLLWLLLSSISTGYNLEWAKEAAENLWKAFSYVGAIVLTHLVTRMFERSIK